MLIARRSLLVAASLAAVPRPAWAQSLSSGMFTHGVASGDPLTRSVILWTRFVGASGHIAWEISEDEQFANVAARGEATASIANDFCVKVDAGGLAPGRRYFYRFLSASGPSVTGRTMTAPEGGIESLTLAFFSCSNMPFGYFHAYGHAAQRDDIDLAVHVGDYIYEVKRGAYPSDAEAVPGRVIDPMNELRSIGDYYQRYASYHSDQNLLELRRLKPLAVVWDDHELVNNTWRDGAQDHDPAEDGPFAPRMAAATKAYFDWMPIRRPEPRGVRVYRTLDWGDLARIVLLDTRFIGRDQQLDYRTTTLTQRLAAGGADAAAAVAEFRAVLENPNRTIMGAAQERWFAEALAQSKSRGQTWQIVAQQIVVGPQLTPQGATALLPETASDGTRAWMTGNEQLAAQGLPWNLDSWDGYPAARTRFLQACAANAANAVVLAGDSHNCWMNNLPGDSGRMAAVEFAGGSVSSPGFERTLSRASAGAREAAFKDANSNLAWSDLTNRGYGVLHLSRTQCASEWLAFNDVHTPVTAAPRVTRFTSTPSASAGPGAWTI